MVDPQDIANRIGAALRNTEAAQAAGDTATAQAQTAVLHGTLVEAFNYLNDEAGFDLNMDEIVGNSPKTAAFHTNAGGPKD